jgi:molybdopterin-guanine dinucleotide biosynthesis protein A
MTGIILAGGKNLRLGTNKAFVKICGKRILDHIYEVLKAFFSEIILVTNEPLLYTYLSVKIATDILPDKGPLGGLFTGLFYTHSFPAMVVSCDLPFLKQNLIKLLLDNRAPHLDLVLPITPDGYQPLCALYGIRAFDVIKQQLAKGDFQISHIFRYLKKRTLSPKTLSQVDTDFRSFLNVNTPADLALAKQLCEKSNTNLR